jgi:hypothetical protein
MSNNVYYPKSTFEIVTQRYMKVNEDVFYNENYTLYSNLFNLVITSGGYSKSITLANHIATLKSNSNNTLKPILKLYNDINTWLDDNPTNIIHNNSSNRVSPMEFYNMLGTKLFFEVCSFKRSYQYYRIGHYTLLENNNDDVFFGLMVKKEYIRYVKLCTLLGEPILEDCFEFWYDKSMIVRKGDAKVLKVLNKILKDFKLIDLPCIEKENISLLFKPEIKFVAPSISRQKEMINEFAEEFRQHELKIIK